MIRQSRPRTSRLLAGSMVAVALIAGSLGTSQAQGRQKTLRFEEPMTAVINARHWDRTEQQWNKEKHRLFFDAVHRFLLIRFPGSAATVKREQEGMFLIQSARLILEWDRQEFYRVAGYAWRGYAVKDKPEPQWHARAWLLRKPWTDDVEVGPTWNAYINGAGYWRHGGGRSPVHDRSAEPLGQALCSKEHPTAEIDVTASLRDSAWGTLGERLRRVEDCGFLVDKAELYNREYGEKGLCTGVARIYVKSAKLVVTLRVPDKAGWPLDLPPAPDLAAMAERLRRTGEGGLPSTVIPENLAELAEARQKARRADMPDWMWQHVQQVRRIPPYWGRGHGYEWFTTMMNAFDSGDREAYLKSVEEILRTPPGWFGGHQHIEYILPLIEYDTMLPDVVRYHLRQGFLARWDRPLTPKQVFAHGKIHGMGTLNHMANVRPKALLGAEATGDVLLAREAKQGLALLYRMMIWPDGFSQEMGDSYYRGITMAPLQTAAKYSVDPLQRLKASLAVEKLRLEDIATFHPGLRRRVSRISRRMGEPFAQSLLLHQDVAEAALHMLSRKGTFIELDAPGDPPTAHGLRPFNFHSSPAARVALVAPWGQEWECHGIDDKPLPFKAVFSTYVMGRTTEPIHAMTYMGRHFALASEEAYTSATVPMLAEWRRTDRPVTHVDQLGVMVIQGRVNDEPPAPLEMTPFGILQHDNKLIYAMKPLEDPFLRGPNSVFESVKKEGLRGLKCQATLFAYGPETQREVWVNDRRIKTFPAKAKHGDRIAIREGVTYLGLVALPATNLGRRDEVVIRQAHPMLTLESFLLQSDKPMPETKATADALAQATAGWAVELGDASTHVDFAAFRRHLAKARLTCEWKPEERVLHLAYKSGTDTLAMGFRTTFQRKVLWHQQLNPSKVFAYQKVNGAWPWPGRGIDMDSPLAQMGKASRLEKGGAVLETVEGQTALLRVEPISKTYEGANPFVDPTPFRLRTPEGVIVQSEGPLGCGRVTIQPGQGRLWVDYHLPPPIGDTGAEWLQKHRPKYFRPGADVSQARRLAARALLVEGPAKAPQVILNGTELPGPFARTTVNGRTVWRIPIVRPASSRR